MDFDYHIPEDSLQARYIEMIVEEFHVTPHEAIRLALDKGLRATLKDEKTPAEEMIGAFSSPSDVAALERAMDFISENRKSYDSLRNFEE